VEHTRVTILQKTHHRHLVVIAEEQWRVQVTDSVLHLNVDRRLLFTPASWELFGPMMMSWREMIIWTEQESQVKLEPSDPLYVQAINSTTLEMRVANINRGGTIFSVTKSNDSISVVVCPAIYRRV
jgi:hypothetical protein